MTNKVSPQDRRFAAIKLIVESVIDSETGVVKYDGAQNRDDIVKAIEGLRAFGRTQRWQDAVTAWQNMMTDIDSDGRYAFDMRFAVAQGSMYTIWANV